MHFVDSDEGHIQIARHGLDSGNPVARILRLDLLFASDQRDRVDADAFHDFVINLARQQPQRQANDTR